MSLGPAAEGTTHISVGIFTRFSATGPPITRPKTPSEQLDPRSGTRTGTNEESPPKAIVVPFPGVEIEEGTTGIPLKRL